MSSRHIHRLIGIVAASALVATLGVVGASASGGTARTFRPANLTAAVTVQAPAAVTPASTDGDNIQEGDQTTPDTGVGADPAEANSAPDGDNVQEGDQTTPDTGVGADPAEAQAATRTAKLTISKAATLRATHVKAATSVVKIGNVHAVKTVLTADPAGNSSAEGPDAAAETSSEAAGETSETPTETSTETSGETVSDGPGGHADPAGPDVQHESTTEQ